MIGSRGSSADLILIARTSPHWCECNQLALALVLGRFWRALGPVLEPSWSSGGCWEAAGSAYIGSQRAAGVVWNMAGVVSKRFREGLGRHGDPFWGHLGAFPNTSRSSWRPLGDAGRRWIDKNSGLETSRSHRIDENNVLEAPRSRWIDKTSGFSGTWSATAGSKVASNRYPEPPKNTIFYMILNS